MSDSENANIVQETLKDYDENFSGVLEKKEIYKFFEELYGNKASKEIILKRIKDLDLDQNQLISPEEFKKYITKFALQLNYSNLFFLQIKNIQIQLQINKMFFSPCTNVFEKSTQPLCLNNFSCLSLLGQGSYGQVYKVQSKRTKQLYAIKKINKKMILKEDAQSQLALEITILQKTQHKNILTFFTYFEDKDHFYIVTEFAEKGNLFTFLKEKKLSENQIREFFLQILEGLNYLHNFYPKILHRDLKPENILVTQKNELKLADFGVSRFFSDKVYSFVGTPNYLSPELISRKGYDEKSDIWSLGVLLFELYTGNLPFTPKKKCLSRSEYLNSLYENILKNEPQQIKKFDFDLKNLLLALLNKNPKQRPSCEEIKNFVWIKKKTEKEKTNKIWKDLKNLVRSTSNNAPKKKSPKKITINQKLTKNLKEQENIIVNKIDKYRAKQTASFCN